MKDCESIGLRGWGTARRWRPQAGLRARFRQPGRRRRGTAFAFRPGPTGGRHMALSVDPAHLKRYKDVVQLLLKHGRADLVARATLEDVFADEIALAPEARRAESAEG